MGRLTAVSRRGNRPLLSGKKRELVLWLVAVITAAAVLASACSNAGGVVLAGSKLPDMGNTPGNLYSIGAIAYDDESVYYSTSKGTEVILNKRNVNTGEQQELSYSDEMCFCLNVTADFIFYVGSSSSAIHRMDKSGARDIVLGDIKARSLFVYGDAIYFIGGESNAYDGNLYSMGIDGSGLGLLTDDNVREMYFYDGRFYYLAHNDGEYLLYRIDMDGSNKELIVKDTGLWGWFCVYGGDVYYRVSEGAMEMIRKIDADTKVDSLVYETEKMMPNSRINTAGNILYFVSTSPMTYTCLDMDTGEEKTTSNSRLNNIIGMYTVGNKVFYYQNEKIYMMNIDGSGRKRFG